MDIHFSAQWPPAEAFPLPLDLRGLPAVQAEPWVRVGEGHLRPRLEGSVFDRSGNLFLCFRCYPGSKILRVAPDGAVREWFDCPDGCLTGLAVHKDGRIFAADIDGRLLVLDGESRVERELFSQFPGMRFFPNDLVFDRNGDLYFTNFLGSRFDPAGGVYMLPAAGNYTELLPVVTGLAGPNGLGFTPDWKQLWISETANNDVFKFDPVCSRSEHLSVFTATACYQMNGYEMFDSLKVDAAGNCYIGVMYGGRALIVNSRGIPVGNVIAAGRAEGKNLMSPNLALKPGTREGYLLTSDADGAWVCRFPAMADAMPLYADM